MGPAIANVNEFEREVTGEVRRWRFSSWLWGIGYGAVIVATIALPAIVSVEGLTDQFGWAGPLVPYLALVTAVAAALNVALTAGPRWHAYMQDVDEGVSIRSELREDVGVLTMDRRRELRTLWDALKARHRSHRPGGGSIAEVAVKQSA